MLVLSQELDAGIVAHKKMEKELEEEDYLLCRVLYRSTNQHSKTKYFNVLCEVLSFVYFFFACFLS